MNRPAFASFAAELWDKITCEGREIDCYVDLPGHTLMLRKGLSQAELNIALKDAENFIASESARESRGGRRDGLSQLRL